MKIDLVIDNYHHFLYVDFFHSCTEIKLIFPYQKQTTQNSSVTSE